MSKQRHRRFTTDIANISEPSVCLCVCCECDVLIFTWFTMLIQRLSIWRVRNAYIQNINGKLQIASQSKIQTHKQQQKQKC